MLRKALLVSLLMVAGCSDDSSDGSPSPATDSGTVKDTGVVVDSTPSDTGSTTDTGTAADGTVSDTGTETGSSDTGTAAPFDSAVFWDTAGACHTMGFGAAAVDAELVTTLPTMTGGTVVPGIYDAIGFKLIPSGAVSGGAYQGTWNFRSDGTMDTIDRISSTGTLGSTVTPRTATWSTSGTTLNRTQTCGGSTSFSNDYTVRTESGVTFADFRSGNLMFTFRKR